MSLLVRGENECEVTVNVWRGLKLIFISGRLAFVPCPKFTLPFSSIMCPRTPNTLGHAPTQHREVCRWQRAKRKAEVQKTVDMLNNAAQEKKAKIERT